MKTLHFDAGKLPDYSSVPIQQLYLLRYAYAYAYEYKLMYNKLLRSISAEHVIKVTSLGCGNMIDYWSLAHSAPSQCIHYIGIDVVDWSYKIRNRDQDCVEFIREDIVTYFRQVPELSSDIYIFPKSISELTIPEIHIICEIIAKKDFQKKEIYFLISLRSDEHSRNLDMQKTGIIFRAISQCGYQTDDKCDVFTHIRQSHVLKKIRTQDSDFEHPADVVGYLKDLHTYCANFKDVSCEDDCGRRLDRWPVLNCGNVCWQMFRFHRSE